MRSEPRCLAPVRRHREVLRRVCRPPGEETGIRAGGETRPHKRLHGEPGAAAAGRGLRERRSKGGRGVSVLLDLVLGGLVAASFLVAIVLAPPWLLRQIEVSRLRRVCRARRLLALSYDDGPGPTLTPQLLSRLSASGVKASFFPLGARAEGAPEVLDQVRREGHEVGSHSMRHVNAWRSNPVRSVRDMLEGFACFSPSRLFRPPHGKLTIFHWLILRGRGTRTAWWTIDAGDTWEPLPAVDDVVARVREQGGGVVLLHDFDRSADRCRYVLDLTSRLLELAVTERLHVLPLGEILEAARRGDAN